MASTEDTPDHLEVEIDYLKSKITALERNQLSDEDRLRLEIFRNVPFTMWACDRNFRIVFWNTVCEEIYGVDADVALGSNYAELFVDAPEQEQSRCDCMDIIDNDATFTNFLAYDVNIDGQRRSMLTNCFRIWDAKRNTFLQAEVALEISDLSLKGDEHRTLREVGIARLEQEKKIVDLRKNESLSRLAQAYAARIRVIDRDKDRIDGFKEESIAGRANPEQIDELLREGQQKLEMAINEIENKHREITARILTIVMSEEDFEALENEIRRFANETPEL